MKVEKRPRNDNIESERDYKDGQLKAPHDSEVDSSATNNIKVTGKID